MMSSKKIAFLLAFLSSVIYGLSFTIAKDVMPLYVKPFGFILLRIIGATTLFWLIGFFIKKEKIILSDYPRIFLASIFGMALNMLTFFKGLSMTTPINASVIMVITPIIVLTFSAFLLKEKATKRKLSGIFIGMFGAILLIVYGNEIGVSSNAVLGNVLVFINATSYALYLILVKSLTLKYHPLTLAKWLYLFGLILVLPFGIQEFKQIDWAEIPIDGLLRISYVVIFTTFFAYLFNLFAIKKLKPTTISIFIYLQPVLATTYALIVGSDVLNEMKILATILIFIGVYLVSYIPVKTTDRD